MSKPWRSVSPNATWTEEDVERAARDSREAQGLPPYIEDPQVLARAVELLRPYLDEEMEQSQEGAA